MGGETTWISNLSRYDWAVAGVLRGKTQVVNALDTEALDFVGCSLGVCVSFAHSTLDFVHDSANDGAALGVVVVGGLNIDRDDDQLDLMLVQTQSLEILAGELTSC